jgi:hypothetical protein
MALASRKPSGSDYQIGDLVRVGPAEITPGGTPAGWRGAIDGAQGVVCDITRDPKTATLQYHVALNRATIDQLPEDYLRECRERRLQPSVLVLDADQMRHNDWSTERPPSW